jgi:hypothetical protein
MKADYLPQLLGWDDIGQQPILVLEDLSAAYWPPPWDRRQIESVLETLAKVRATPPPSGLPVLTPTFFRRPGVSLASWSAARAGLPRIPDAPRVREVQLQHLLSALPWVVRALGLPPLDGQASP